jgi:acetolactate synthase-1/2/3 large subunit
MGVGSSATPAGANAFADCDVLLAVGTRFSEIATGGFGLKPNWKLIHADINANVFNANYPAAATISGDAREVLKALIERLPRRPRARDGAALRQRIAADKQGYLDEWLKHDPHGRVNPARFFIALRRRLADDAYLVADDGNHTFLVAELFAATRSRRVISPSDFNCMGYCVPAAIGIKLTHREQEVVGIVGDGAFLMTGTEILTATELKLGIVYYVFHDGELSQISQAQALSYNRKACSVLPEVQIKGIADAVGAIYLEMADDDAIEAVIEKAHAASGAGRPVIVDVRIDYSKATRFTKSVIRTNFYRLSLADKARTLGRAVWRHAVAPSDIEPRL